MDNYPFTSVYPGRVISVTEHQHVQGGGVILGGWGGMRVNTVSFHEFWLKSPNFGDLCFKMGSAEIPPMLPDHAITVIVAGTEVCAIANHSIGVHRFYRPKGVYQVNKGGALFLLPALICLAVLEFSGYRALVQAAQGTVIVAWLVLVAVINFKVLEYNARLDKRLQALIDVAQTEHTASIREVNLPPLPWKEA